MNDLKNSDKLLREGTLDPQSCRTIIMSHSIYIVVISPVYIFRHIENKLDVSRILRIDVIVFLDEDLREFPPLRIEIVEVDIPDVSLLDDLVRNLSVEVSVLSMLLSRIVITYPSERIDPIVSLRSDPAESPSKLDPPKWASDRIPGNHDPP